MHYPRTWTLPDKDTRIAFIVGLAFEAFDFRSQYSQMPTGKSDPFSLSYGDYGWKAGAWRLFDILGEMDAVATMSTNGLAAQRHPHVVQAAVKQGIEVSGHGWANDVRCLEPEAELDEIRRSTKALTEAAGERPLGWICQGLSGTENTNRLLAQEGYIWNSDDASDDIPFLRDTGAGDMVVFPRQGLHMNDLSVWALARNSPAVVWENYKDTFDTLYAESVKVPRILDITLHCQFAGRPTFIPTVRRMLEYAKRHEGVKFVCRRDIARWVMSQKREDYLYEQPW